jgi:hypothetical protein
MATGQGSSYRAGQMCPPTDNLSANSLSPRRSRGSKVRESMSRGVLTKEYDRQPYLKRHEYQK